MKKTKITDAKRTSSFQRGESEWYRVVLATKDKGAAVRLKSILPRFKGWAVLHGFTDHVAAFAYIAERIVAKETKQVDIHEFMQQVIDEVKDEVG